MENNTGIVGTDAEGGGFAEPPVAVGFELGNWAFPLEVGFPVELDLDVGLFVFEEADLEG